MKKPTEVTVYVGKGSVLISVSGVLDKLVLVSAGEHAPSVGLRSSQDGRVGELVTCGPVSFDHRPFKVIRASIVGETP